MSLIVRSLPTWTFSRSESSSSYADAAFAPLWLFITFVSAWDGYLTLLWHHQMPDAELNPVGQFLIGLNQGGVAYLLLAKLIGTVIASSWMVILYERNHTLGLLTVTGVAGFQLWLLLFLTLA